MITLALLLALVLLLVICRRYRRARVLVIGTTPLARQIAVALTAARSGGFQLAGMVDDGASSQPELLLDRHIAGPLDRLAQIIETVRPDRIVIALGDRRGRLPMPILLNARLRGIRIVDGVRFFERLAGKVAIEALTPDHLVSAGGFRAGALEAAVGRVLSL